ncbi:hypothetical protein HQ487_00670 [Candidatus Uhrbacteria bacterium]|nr:hypothetical protein [Candidatus Uhrbacteria bacterium]
MTPEQRCRLAKIALPHFAEALRHSVKFVGESDSLLKKELLPFWRAAVHRTLVEVGACPCIQKGEGCFLSWNADEEQKRLPPDHSLSFPQFLNTFKEGAATAQLAMTNDQHADIH